MQNPPTTSQRIPRKLFFPPMTERVVMTMLFWPWYTSVLKSSTMLTTVLYAYLTSSYLVGRGVGRLTVDDVHRVCAD